jgi:undecaprenyl pyrophosphate synthase
MNKGREAHERLTSNSGRLAVLKVVVGVDVDTDLPRASNVKPRAADVDKNVNRCVLNSKFTARNVLLTSQRSAVRLSAHSHAQNKHATVCAAASEFEVHCTQCPVDVTEKWIQTQCTCSHTRTSTLQYVLPHLNSKFAARNALLTSQRSGFRLSAHAHTQNKHATVCVAASELEVHCTQCPVDVTEKWSQTQCTCSHTEQARCVLLASGR